MTNSTASSFGQYAAIAAQAAGQSDVFADFQGLQQIPQLLGNVRTGVLAMRSLVHAPQAAMASGNPMVGGAIVALGAQMLVFLYQTVQAIDDDIDAITQVARNYRDQEDRVVTGTNRALDDLARCSVAPPPALTGGPAPVSSAAGHRVTGGEMPATLAR